MDDRQERSEQNTVETMRYELGREAKQKGEPLHDGASEEYTRGYHSYGGIFGSNVAPRRFGAGSRERTEWTCVCGELNKRYRNQCFLCGVHRHLALAATEGEE